MDNTVLCIFGHILEDPLTRARANFLFTPAQPMTEINVHKMFTFFSPAEIITMDMGTFHGINAHAVEKLVPQDDILCCMPSHKSIPISFLHTDGAERNYTLVYTLSVKGCVAELVSNLNKLNQGKISQSNVESVFRPYGIWSPRLNYLSIVTGTFGHVR